MANKKLRIILVTIMAAFVIMIIMASLVSKGGSDKEKGQATSGTVASSYGKVVVAAVDIQPRVPITPEMVKVVDYPVEYIHPNAAKTIEQVQDKLSLSKITVGEFVMTDRIADKTNGGLTFKLNKDEVAYTIPASELSAGAGLIQVNDQIHIQGLFDKEVVGDRLSEFVLSDLRVIAIGQDMTENAKAETLDNYSSLTVALLPEQAQILSWAENWGRITIIPKSAYNQEASPVTQGVTTDTMFGKYDVYKTKKYVEDLKDKLAVQELVKKLNEK